jgi:VCBS repeat-containing protein
MKVTALLPDDIIQEVKKLSGGKNITESILIALKDYIAQQRIRKSIQKVKDKPLQFRDGFSAEKVRSLNREP